MTAMVVTFELRMLQRSLQHLAQTQRREKPPFWLGFATCSAPGLAP